MRNDILQYMTTDEEFNAIWQAVQDGEYDTSDLHRAVAAKKLGITSRLVTEEQRRAAKEANYVRLYSARPALPSTSKPLDYDTIDYSHLEQRVMQWHGTVTGRMKSDGSHIEEVEKKS